MRFVLLPSLALVFASVALAGASAANLPESARVSRTVYSLADLARPMTQPNHGDAPLHIAHASAAQAVATPAGAATVLLQVGAFQNEEHAHSALEDFEHRYGTVFGNAGTSIRKVDLGAKGVWYRLHVGPFTDRASAATACTSLQAQGAPCMLTAMPRERRELVSLDPIPVR